MLVEIDKESYRKYFPVDPNPFISEEFIEINLRKTDRVVRIIDNGNEPVIGFVAGIKNKVLQSPFSAPFGGFHFRKENLYVNEIDRFLEFLKEYAIEKGIKRIEITLPPNIYHETFNAKTLNSLIRHNYQFGYPEITSWIELENFTGTYSQKNSREYFRQAQRNNLTFFIAENNLDQREIYEVICENRTKFSRPIYMTFEDIVSMTQVWPVDFFKVETPGKKIVASAIIYRNHPEICYAVFWGDNEEGRILRAMDFLLLNLFTYYKKAGFTYLDIGTSTENGIPNEGLLRFKESHEAVSSLKYKCILEIN